MRPVGRPAADKQPESIEFVPKRDLDRAKQENERLRKEIERLKQETERLRRELEAALRASKRQAAPHSRGTPKANPQRPGRKPGRRYGRQACRPIPARVDERVTVPLPECCPHCGGGVEAESCETQYQEEIVRRTIVRRFDIAVGHCCKCKRRVQGRHPLQTSDAVGVGSVQLGPEALTLAAILNKQMGLSLGHTRQVLSYGFGLEVSRGGLYRALARMAGRAQPTYDGLVDIARQAPVNGIWPHDVTFFFLFHNLRRLLECQRGRLAFFTAEPLRMSNLQESRKTVYSIRGLQEKVGIAVNY